MSELYETCKAQFEDLTTSIAARLADGRLSLQDIGGVIQAFSRAAVVIAKPLKVPGVDKKALVVEAAGTWWDDKLAAIIPGPDVLTRAALLLAVGVACDYIVALFGERGWPWRWQQTI